MSTPMLAPGDKAENTALHGSTQPLLHSCPGSRTFGQHCSLHKCTSVTMQTLTLQKPAQLHSRSAQAFSSAIKLQKTRLQNVTENQSPV